MNFAYLPMGSMQLGPNGELIPASLPSSITATAGRVPPTAYQIAHPVAQAAAAGTTSSASSQPNGSSTQSWKMQELQPLYTTSQLGHSFAVMEPLSSGHATMLPMAVTGKKFFKRRPCTRQHQSR